MVSYSTSHQPGGTAGRAAPTVQYCRSLISSGLTPPLYFDSSESLLQLSPIAFRSLTRRQLVFSTKAHLLKPHPRKASHPSSSPHTHTQAASPRSPCSSYYTRQPFPTPSLFQCAPNSRRPPEHRTKPPLLRKLHLQVSMGWPKCNSTLENETIDELPIWHGYDFHLLGLWLSAVFGIVAVAVSFFLIFMHTTHYLKPWEQRHIIRILFMVPVYAAVSFLSFKYYKHSIYFEVLRDCYEAFAIASFFSLMCAYISVDLHSQKDYFRSITPKRWIWPLPWIQKCWGGEHGTWRTPRSGLTWFNVCGFPQLLLMASNVYRSSGLLFFNTASSVSP